MSDVGDDHEPVLTHQILLGLTVQIECYLIMAAYDQQDRGTHQRQERTGKVRQTTGGDFHDDRYVIRADLPGLDPEKDIEITVADGTLTIHAERHEERREMHRTELHYGTLTRTLKLPSGVDTEDIKARYDNGVLEVSVAMPEAKPAGRRVMIEQES